MKFFLSTLVLIASLVTGPAEPVYGAQAICGDCRRDFPALRGGCNEEVGCTWREYEPGERPPDALEGQGVCDCSPLDGSCQDEIRCAAALCDRIEPGPGCGAPAEAGGAEKKADEPAVPGAPVNASIPKLENPLGEGTTVPALLGRVINAFLGISGSVALLMFVYGGFMWLTSGGSEDRIKKGKETVVWAALGIALIFSAYALLNFVIQRALGL